jgi:excisionase family DNA binding protein
MNDTVLQDFAEAVHLVNGDRAAAANLALASALRDEHGSSERLPTASAGRPMTVPEVAKFLRVRPNKVLAWIRSGRLRAYNVAERENGRPKYRVDPDDLRAFQQKRAITQPVPRGRQAGRHCRFPEIERPHL